MKTADLAFIIVGFNPQERAIKSLLSVLPGYRTIIIDNGGTLTPVDAGKATLLTQSKNIGFSAAANIGIRHAIAYGAEWFIVLNQDTAMTTSAVVKLRKLLESLPPGIAGPIGGALDAKRWTTMLDTSRVEYITGSCIAIHQKVIQKIGYFWEPYFLYYEDVDFCIRARNAGFTMTKFHIEGIVHEETASLGKGSYAHGYYLARNHLYFIERLAPKRIKLYEFARFAKTIVEHLTRREIGALHGVFDYILRRTGELSRRTG